MKLTKESKILIVGLGLMGGSYALALKKKGYFVSAVTRSEDSIRFALENQMIDRGAAALDPSLIGDADLVIFALYPHVFVEWLKENQGLLRSGCLITDVTGVKESVVAQIQEFLREDVEFVAAHPMAGRELTGVKHASETIFEGANYIVVPTEKNTREAVATCEALGCELGFRRVSTLSPKEHDEMIAFLSQLTHCIAVALMCAHDDERLFDYTGDSFRDLTRIARINDEMWSELFLLNREALLAQIDVFSEKLSALRQTIQDGDREAMREMMVLSSERRKKFEK